MTDVQDRVSLDDRLNAAAMSGMTISAPSATTSCNRNRRFLI